MENAKGPILSHIQRLPDEVLAGLFVVGSWLPGRFDHSYPYDPMHAPRLKPYAKLVSQVCARWRRIVHWHSNRHELCYVTLSLKYSEGLTAKTEFVPVLKAYLDGIKKSEGAELDVEWFFPQVEIPDRPTPLIAAQNMMRRLFLHGMNRTVPHFGRVRSLKVHFRDPQLLVFFFLILNNIRGDLVLTHLEISVSGDSSWPLLASEPPFVPTCAPFNSSPGVISFNPVMSFSALSHLTLALPFDIMDKFIIPASSLHLSLSEAFNVVRKNDLWAVILQCYSLRTLAIELPDLVRLPVRTSSNQAIDLPCLSELTLANINVCDIIDVLPLLTIPSLKCLYLDRLYVFGVSDEVEAMYSAAYEAPSVVNCVAPQQLRLRLRSQRNKLFSTIVVLLSCMTPDRLELLEIHAEDFGAPDSDLIYTSRSMGQAIFEFIREDPRRAYCCGMLEVRVMAWDGTLLYSTLEDADSMPEYITVSP